MITCKNHIPKPFYWEDGMLWQATDWDGETWQYPGKPTYLTDKRMWCYPANGRTMGIRIGRFHKPTDPSTTLIQRQLR